MPVKKPIFVAVDRIEGLVAVLEGDDGHTFEVPVKSFKHKPKEGMVYRVPVDSRKNPEWAHAVSDPTEASRRLADRKRRMDARRKHDNGGDIEL
jgi:hypothetical protein